MVFKSCLLHQTVTVKMAIRSNHYIIKVNPRDSSAVYGKRALGRSYPGFPNIKLDRHKRWKPLKAKQSWDKSLEKLPIIKP